MSRLKPILYRMRDWWGRRSEATRELPKYLGQAVLNYIRTGSGSRQAAGLSYYAIFSVFPLTLLMAVGIGSLVGPAVAQEQIVRGLEMFLPANTALDIRNAVIDAIEQSSSFGLVATAALLWAATGLFTNISLALDNIFEVTQTRNMLRQRVLAIIMGLTLVVLVVASFVTSGVLRLFSALSPGVPNIWVRVATYFLPIGLDVVIFALLFQYVPNRQVHWDAVWPAAIFGAFGWEVAKRAFEWYLANLANYAIIYGSIATGIVLLFWAWVIASIFLFSAELCARLNEWIEAEEARQTHRRIQEQRIAIFLQEDRAIATPDIPQLPDTRR